MEKSLGKSLEFIQKSVRTCGLVPLIPVFPQCIAIQTNISRFSWRHHSAQTLEQVRATWRNVLLEIRGYHISATFQRTISLFALLVRVHWTFFKGKALGTRLIYSRLSGFQSSLLLIYLREGANRRSHCIKVWQKTYPMCDAALSRSVRRSFGSSQKLRRHNRSCVWTEALSGIIYDAAQKLSGVVWT